MVKIIEATCTNGELVLHEKLSPELEGKTIQIMIIEPDKSTQSINSQELGAVIQQVGIWKDERSDEEIIKEIYDSRTISNQDISL